jgi:hypothetical protein
MPAHNDGEGLRGRHKLALIRLLAVGELTQAELAEEFGVTQPSIAAFKKRNLAEIQHVKANLEDEFAGLWIARKKDRVAELEDIAERFARPGLDPKHAQIRLRALRQASEELGQLRIQIDTNAQVEYSVEGVDPEELK